MAYIGKSPSQGVRQRYYFTATGGETSISGTDDNGKTLVFSDGEYIDVYLNGVLLVAGTDYVTTTANTIGSLASLAASDIVEIVAYDIFSVADTVSASAGGTFSANVSWGDNNKAIFGAGSDLQIYHDVSHSYIVDNGTGNLRIKAQNFQVLGNADNEAQIEAYQNDGVYLYFNGNQRAATTSGGINVTGTVTADGLTVDGTAEIRSTGPTQLLIEDTDNGFAATSLSVENGGRDFHIDTPQDIVFEQGGSERMRVDSSGNLLVGATAYTGNTTNTGGGVYVDGSGSIVFSSSTGGSGVFNRISTDGNVVEFRKDGSTVGSISVTGSATAYNTSSDYRLKENVVDMTGATERLKQLNPVRFNFIADADTTVDGFLAHEVQDIVPEAITGTKDEVDADGNAVYQGIDQSKLVPLLVATIQELEARIAALESN